MNTKYITNSDFTIIPETPGIYSWFYPIRLYDQDTYESFFHRVQFFLLFSIKTNDSIIQNILHDSNTWEELQISLGINYRENKTLKKDWAKLKKDKEFKHSLLQSSFWNRPLYVGKADNLNRRINDHIEGRSDFNERFNNACEKYNFNNNADFKFSSAFSFRNLLLSYTIFPKDNLTVSSLEKTLQITSRPNFSKL
jgi:hypothetical protein